MQVIYSNPACFGGWGLGHISHMAVRGIHRHGALKRVFSTGYVPTEIPESLIRVLPRSGEWVGKTPLPYRLRKPLQNRCSVVGYDTQVSRAMESCDVFHGYASNVLRAGRAARELGAKVVLDCATSHILNYRDLIAEEYARYAVGQKAQPSWMVERCLSEFEESDHVIVCSDFSRQSFIDRGFPINKVTSIPYGVDTTKYHPRREPRRDRTFRVIFTGQICLRKGVPYLLEAWKRLRLPNAELMLVGMLIDDALKVVEFYQDPSIRIVQHSSGHELVAHYQESSVFAFPSIEDGFAMVVTEAMACGLPVIISENTGAKEVVREGIDGYVLRIRDVEALMDRITRLYEDKDMREEMGRNARERALECTWEHYGERLMDVYAKLTGASEASKKGLAVGMAGGGRL